MEQLSSFDELCLATETLTANANISTLAIYDQSEVPDGPVKFRHLLEAANRAVLEIPRLRQRLLRVPLAIDRSYWIDDENFDLEYHVRHIALPRPGDWRQLCIQFSRLHSRPVDLSRPLWEMYVIECLDQIEGLPEASFAVVLKLHHAMLDGSAFVRLLELLHQNPAPSRASKRAAEKPFVDFYRPYQPQRGVSKLEVFSRALSTNAKLPLRFSRLLTSVATNAMKKPAGTGLESKGADEGPPLSRFNVPVTSHRVFGAASFDINELKRIKRLVPGATLNDVASSIIGGALRSYLQTKGDLPASSLVTTTPVSLRQEGDTELGNKVGFMSHTIGTDQKNPLKRLAQVREATQAAKDAMGEDSQYFIVEALDVLPVPLIALVQKASTALTFLTGRGMAQNTVISNVPGPSDVLHLCGARLAHVFGASIVADNQALSHALGSYNGKLNFSFTACRAAMPDPDFYTECLHKSYADLLSAANSLEAGKSVEANGSYGTKASARQKAPARKPRRSRSTKKPAGK